MKIQRLLPLVSALGIGLFATSCNHYNHQGYRQGATVGQYRTGYQVRSLPPRYQTMSYGGTRYYYNDNVYYRPHSSGYIVVDNPRGVTTTTRYSSNRTVAPTTTMIRTLPRGHRLVTYNGVRYYQSGESYYQPTGGGYQIVSNPYQNRRRNWR